MAKRILVPLDRGEEAEAGVPLVADLARSSGATVRLLHVAPHPQMRTDTHGRVIAYADQESDRLDAEGQDYLWTIEAQLDGVPVERRVRFGDAAEEILLEADAFGADLIALTAAKRGWFRRSVLGGVAKRVLRKAPAPVMLLAALTRG